MVDVITESAREGLMKEILYANDLVLVSDTMEEQRRRFQKWREAFETKGLRVNLKKTKVMVSGCEGELARSKIDPCDVHAKKE